MTISRLGRTPLGTFFRTALGARGLSDNPDWVGPDSVSCTLTINSVKRYENLISNPWTGTYVDDLTVTDYCLTYGGMERLLYLGLVGISASAATIAMTGISSSGSPVIAETDSPTAHPGWSSGPGGSPVSDALVSVSGTSLRAYAGFAMNTTGAGSGGVAWGQRRTGLWNEYWFEVLWNEPSTHSVQCSAAIDYTLTFTNL